MDFKVFFATFTAIFAAELADKTQFVGMSMTAKSGRPYTVWAGSVAAYMLATVLSVFLGAVASKYLRPDMVKYIGGSIFMIMGALMFLGKI